MSISNTFKQNWEGYGLLLYKLWITAVKQKLVEAVWEGIFLSKQASRRAVLEVLETQHLLTAAGFKMTTREADQETHPWAEFLSKWLILETK